MYLKPVTYNIISTYCGGALHTLYDRVCRYCCYLLCYTIGKVWDLSGRLLRVNCRYKDIYIRLQYCRRKIVTYMCALYVR